MEEGLRIICGCGRNPVGTMPAKGTKFCKYGCGMWVIRRPNLLVRLWQFLKDD